MAATGCRRRSAELVSAREQPVTTRSPTGLRGHFDIVHFEKIRGYNGVNLLHGYGLLSIHSPPEVTVGSQIGGWSRSKSKLGYSVEELS